MIFQVPIITHNESEQAKTWSRIYSEETKKQSIPVITAWQLNERMYATVCGFESDLAYTFSCYKSSQLMEYKLVSCKVWGVTGI